MLRLARTEDAAAVARIYAPVVSDTAISFELDPPDETIARALYTALLAQLELMGFYAAHAGIALPNPASVGLHEGLGFLPVGVYRAVGYKLGAWHDVGWWQRELRPRRGAPGPLLTVDEAQGEPGWARTLG